MIAIIYRKHQTSFADYLGLWKLTFVKMVLYTIVVKMQLNKVLSLDLLVYNEQKLMS